MQVQAKTRRVAVAVATFSVALGIGFVMQNGDALAGRFVEPVAPPSGQLGLATGPVLQPMAQAMPMPGVGLAAMPARMPMPQVLPRPAAEPVLKPTVIPVQAQPAPDRRTETPIPGPLAQPEAPRLLAALEAEPAPDAPLAQPEPVPELACQPGLTATPLPEAMVALTLTAPCAPDSMVTLHHQGMMFTALTDATGGLQVTVPALVAGAMFIADLGDGAGAVAVADVPEAAQIDRAVLLWQGLDGLMIHAREFGAGYGAPGHVWSGAPGNAQAAQAGEGGFLIRLGDPAIADGMMAEVYTYPSFQTRRSGTVVLTVEAEVTAGNCGRDVSAQAIQMSPGGPPFAADLTMTLPDCDALGEILVLNNMLMDLTLAAR